MDAGTPCRAPRFVNVEVPTARSPIAVAIGQFGGSALPDLLVAHHFDARLALHLGLDGGAFGPATSFATGNKPYAIAARDLDGTGVLAVAVPNQDDGTVSFFPSLSGAPATLIPVGASPVWATLADLNRDGRSDLVVPNLAGASVSVMYARPQAPTFPSVLTLTSSAEPHAVEVGEFTGDGVVDLAMVHFGPGQLSIWSGSDAGFAQTQLIPVGGGARAVASADLNGDGLTDLVTVGYLTSGITVLLRASPSAFAAGSFAPTPASPTALAIADVSGDGVLDLVTANSGAGTLSIFVGVGNGTFLQPLTLSVGVTPFSVATGDLNGDGQTDLAVANFGESSVSVRLRNGCGP